MRDLQYYRNVRKKHIRRKQRIIESWAVPNDFLLNQPGRLDKSSVKPCSCPMCTTKSKRDGLPHRDQVKLIDKE